MKAIFIFRHGETDWNRQQRFQGHVDNPLNDLGREQALRLVDPLSRLGIQAILSSDLVRALETGRLIADQLMVPTFQDPGLREANLGEAQGLTKVEIESQFGVDQLQNWKSAEPQHLDVSYPGGETGRQIMIRSISTLEIFLASHEYDRVGISTHGGVIRRLIQFIRPDILSAVPIPNGVLYALEYNSRTGSWRFSESVDWKSSIK